MKRLEISKRVKLEVWERAGGKTGALSCEGCRLRLGGKAFHYDHCVPEVFQPLPASERVITAGDVKLLGVDCCHKAKSSREHKANCHGKRIVEKAARVNVKPQSRFRKKLNGQVVCRETGEVVGRS